VLNWVLAATDAHAKNFALLHGPGGGVRLAPFYDIVSLLPYADARLYRVKMPMKIGGTYLIRRINRTSWESLARSNGLRAPYVLENVLHVLEQLPHAIETVAHRAIDEGLAAKVIEPLADRIRERTNSCMGAMQSR
jgi:serine/threonine-protein kinase HipA